MHPYIQEMFKYKMFDLAREGMINHIEILANEGGDIYCTDAADNNLLMWAITKDQRCKVIDYFLSKSININYQNIHGETALMLAVKHGRSRETIEYLINRGALIAIRDREGRSVIDLGQNDKLIAAFFESKLREYAA